jgi:hypothetical protein
MQEFFLGFSCFSLHPTRAQVEPEPRQGLTAPVPRGGFGCGKIEAHQETRAPRRLTFIVKHQNLSMPLMRASLPLR